MFKCHTVYGTDGTLLERELRGQFSLEWGYCRYCQRLHQFEIGARYVGNSYGHRLFEPEIKRVNIPAIDADMCQ